MAFLDKSNFSVKTSSTVQPVWTFIGTLGDQDTSVVYPATSTCSAYTENGKIVGSASEDWVKALYGVTEVKWLGSKDLARNYGKYSSGTSSTAATVPFRWYPMLPYDELKTYVDKAVSAGYDIPMFNIGGKIYFNPGPLYNSSTYMNYFNPLTNLIVNETYYGSSSTFYSVGFTAIIGFNAAISGRTTTCPHYLSLRYAYPSGMLPDTGSDYWNAGISAGETSVSKTIAGESLKSSTTNPSATVGSSLDIFNGINRDIYSSSGGTSYYYNPRWLYRYTAAFNDSVTTTTSTSSQKTFTHTITINPLSLW